MKKLNKVAVLACSALLLTGCSKTAKGYDHYSSVKTSLSSLFSVTNTIKTLDDYNSSKEAFEAVSDVDSSTSLSIAYSSFKKQSVVEILVASYFGTYPLKFNGYNVTTKEDVSYDDDGNKVVEKKNCVEFKFNFESNGESYTNGYKINGFLIPVSNSDLESASYVSVLLTKEGKTYGGNTAYADYSFNEVEE